eukprot:CAMPEP_0113879304 /NCGR_PEP_ID=MMETSP0780_2-20120614/7166_1 /TAXON_ID=652834 /ORGANISM="Palpitomonas bilix" /LENGTH=221 /DNA_ID=CAMNT_0000865875 /DNA_START=566 /DNA_END=1231 /DNA_ORIENTATION=- /assembly_acc=CAM_ASM_000599
MQMRGLLAVIAAAVVVLEGVSASLQFESPMEGAVVQFAAKCATQMEVKACGDSAAPSLTTPTALAAPFSSQSDTDGLCTVLSISASPAFDEKVGSETEVCVVATAAGEEDVQRCFSLSIPACRLCVEEGESLSTIAADFGLSWLQVWAANPKLKTPNDVQPGQEVALGPAYVVKEGENLYDLASRFRADVDTILRVSPNLSSSSQVEAGQRVCVASSYCSD